MNWGISKKFTAHGRCETVPYSLSCSALCIFHETKRISRGLLRLEKIDSYKFGRFLWPIVGNPLQRLPITRDPPPSKVANKVEFSWTSIKEKPLKLFWILTGSKQS